jgi:DNA-binding Lrp family transcriptional regulator
MAADTLDDTDKRLIQLLRADSRLPTSTIAKRLGVSRGTVQNRIDRLVGTGVLAGFTIRLRGDIAAGEVRAIASLEVRSADTKTVVAALKHMPDIGRIWSTNGRWDLVVEINTSDLGALDRVLHEMRGVKGVSLSETSILLSELK